jgi:predicted nucleic acid-binding protein
MRVLLDTNIIVDVLQQREPWRQDGEAIFIAAAMNQITACVTAKQIADIHYMTKKLFKGQAHIDHLAKQVIGKLMTFMELEDTSAADCQAAMGINNNDFEDAMLMACAARETMDYIVTRNVTHFKGSAVPVVTPADFVKILN